MCCAAAGSPRISESRCHPNWPRLTDLRFISAEYLEGAAMMVGDGEAIHCACECCHYRQLVSGHFWQEPGGRLDKPLFAGTALSADEFNEDGPYRYGRGGGGPEKNVRIGSTRCAYSAEDTIGYGGGVGIGVDSAGWELSFISYIYDSCQGTTGPVVRWESKCEIHR